MNGIVEIMLYHLPIVLRVYSNYLFVSIRRACFASSGLTCQSMIEMLTDCSELNENIDKANQEIITVSEQVGNCIRENTTKALSQAEYDKQYGNLIKRYEKALGKVKKLNTEKAERENRRRELQGFVDSIRRSPLVLDA